MLLRDRLPDPGCVISDVGRALSALMRPALPASAAIRLGPAPAEAAEPALHLALRWVRDDMSGRLSGERDVRADDGSLLGRQGPPRRYELQFFVAAVAATVEEEYELLDAALLSVTGLDAIPAEHLPKPLVDTGLPVLLSVSGAAPVTGAPSGFALLVSAPVLPPLQTELAPPAAEMSMGVRRTPPGPPPAPVPPNGGRRWRRATIDED